MNRLFFYTNIRTWDYTLGITRKVFSEIESFKKLGYDVTYSGYLEDGVAIFDSNHNIIKSQKFFFKNGTINHFLRRSMVMDLCVDYLKTISTSYSFSYARYHFFDNHYIKLLRTLKEKSAKVIIEAHSTPKFQSGLNKFTYIAWKDRNWNKYAKEYVSLVASMSGDDVMWGIPTVKISNGIDINTIRLHNYISNPDDINLIAVSFEAPVHGYDRVIKGMYNYYKNGGQKNVYFHLVGTIMYSTKKLIEKLDLSDRCIIYGPKSGDELAAIYDKANIGIGCLANHRIGSTFGSALKTKEYIAKGIPFVYGWRETVLENFQYALNVELSEEPLDMNRVISFYESLKKDSLALKIRNHLDYKDTWDYQIQTVVNAINNQAN
ncbi:MULTISPECIES: glycosyltransferase family protein [Butyricimonas]|uniref:glycosyltransferase family 1 protein n=1 Tax=Butyricimonas TaxID=574697 RepID=UPI0007FB492A|nr:MULTISPECIES: glycosyltransferase family 1 protein [Butyricimonas]